MKVKYSQGIPIYITTPLQIKTATAHPPASQSNNSPIYLMTKMWFS